MARNLSKDLKRVVAGLCAVLLVGGSVPLQPLNNFVSNTITAKADDVVANEFVTCEPDIIAVGNQWKFVKTDSSDPDLGSVVYKSNNNGNRYTVRGTTATTTFKVYPGNEEVVKILWKVDGNSGMNNSDKFTITINGHNYVNQVTGSQHGAFEIPGTASSGTEGIEVSVQFYQYESQNNNGISATSNAGYISFQMAHKGADLNFDGLTADTDYYVENNADALPGKTVTIYFNSYIRSHCLLWPSSWKIFNFIFNSKSKM